MAPEAFIAKRGERNLISRAGTLLNRPLDWHIPRWNLTLFGILCRLKLMQCIDEINRQCKQPSSQQLRGQSLAVVHAASRQARLHPSSRSNDPKWWEWNMGGAGSKQAGGATQSRAGAHSRSNDKTSCLGVEVVTQAHLTWHQLIQHGVVALFATCG